MNKTFYIENLGCAKNQVDGEVLASEYIKNGYVCLNGDEDAVKKADVIILNTCAFIEEAKKESIETFFALNNTKKKSAKIIVVGCLAERYKDELKASLKEADDIIGGSKATTTKRDGVNFSKKGCAYLKIAEGCNHMCAFCAIPLFKGRFKSVPPQEIKEEFISLLSNGVKDISILAQDISQYGCDLENKTTLYNLLTELLQIEGSYRIRLLYIHPDFFDERLISLIKSSDGKIIPYFDLPMQHCNQEILKNMRRHQNKDYYLTLINKIRSEIPLSYIRSTFLLGFKGENKETIAELKEFLKTISLDSASFFLYSKEERTYGDKLINNEEFKALHKIARSSLKSIEKLQDKITNKNLEKFVGISYPLIVEEKIDDTLYLTHAPFQCPDVDGCTVLTSQKCLNIGDEVISVISKVNNLDLEAVLIQ